MTWTDAQTYCRTHHYDLATVQNEKAFSGYAWIGLYNDVNSWRWSYNEESLVFQSWALGQPNNYGLGEACATISPDGT
ncbi:hypothetical protein M9458_016946, partial [Cirrhinus mrigala]